MTDIKTWLIFIPLAIEKLKWMAHRRLLTKYNSENGSGLSRLTENSNFCMLKILFFRKSRLPAGARI